MGGLRGVSFIGRRRGAGGGAGTGKDARRARHTTAETSRHALIILQSDGTRLACEVKVRTVMRREVGG